jgi:TolB-like protein/Tfp pilus assembly protein PilF
VRDRIDVALEDMGEVEVKNIVRPVRVFRLVLGEFQAHERKHRVKGSKHQQWMIAGVVLVLLSLGATWWFQPWETGQSFSSSPLSAKSSIAVLPFTNLSQDTAQEYFADGITNDLITDLSKFSDLLVIASNSVFAYKGKAMKVERIGRELGVRYVLEGSVQKIGDRVRINAQLIDAANEHHLWADRYDEVLTDLFELQDQITEHIVRTLGVRISDIEQERAFAKPTDDLKAYDYVQRGRELERRLSRRDTFEARKLFRQAIQLDPSYASAYAGLGWTYLNVFLFGWTGAASAAIERAEELAYQALAIDPSNIDGRRLLARIYVNRLRHDLALVELEKVIVNNPNDAQSFAEQGIALIWSSRPDGAINALETARRFDPKMNAEGLAHLALAYYIKKRYADAATTLERGVAQEPGFEFGHQILAAIYGQLGRAEEASRAARTVRRFDPFFKAETFGDGFRNPEHTAHLRDGLRKAGL